jgi:hypothetical protein
MSKRNIGISMIAAGVLLILVSLLADTIGLGANTAVIGWKQILGAVVGAAAGIGGFFLMRRN